jgi:CRISPR-associated Cas5-like protein
MKAIRIVLEAPFGWHVRNPATYRVERTYPVVPPTVLFGIIQNVLYTSPHKTRYRDMIALGGFPKSDVGLSLDLERIAKLYTRPLKGESGKYKHVSDRHEVEVAHSGEIDSFLVVEDNSKADEYTKLLQDRIGEIVLLTTNQFPAIVKKVSIHEIGLVKTNKLLFCLEREGWGLPYVLPLSYKFKKKDDYRAQQYYKVLLPFLPILKDKTMERSEILLKNEIESLEINGACFDRELLNLCRNQWLDKSIEITIGTV